MGRTQGERTVEGASPSVIPTASPSVIPAAPSVIPAKAGIQERPFVGTVGLAVIPTAPPAIPRAPSLIPRTESEESKAVIGKSRRG